MPEPIGINPNGLDKTKTEAPTSGTTKTAEQIAKDNADKLTEDQFDFVNLVHQHYAVNGVLFTGDYGAEHYKLTLKQYQKFMADPVVKKALGERGVPLKPVQPDDESEQSQTWRNLALTGQQIVVADTMLDVLDQRSYKKKLQDLGISTKQWAAWCKEPAFAKYLDDNTSAILKNGQHEAALALMDRVSAGDLKAIEYYHEYTERFVRRTNATTNNPNADAIDAKRIIQQIIEIVIEEVDDHNTAARIADRMKVLMTSTEMANQLTAQPEIIQPEVVPNRQLTGAMVKSLEQANHEGMQL